ncbi:MAG: AAA family ATPase [Deltaproteobacteria bacterium]|nr:AAA family ATPase [Deltaproteobacteria bacterium]
MSLVGAADFPGTKRFEVIRRLGAGGMGVVYEALDRERNCRVALKTVRDLGGEDLLRLKNEFRALQDLQHPNLVSLGELLEEGGRWFFTMELVEGVNFIEHVRPGAGPAAGSVPKTDSNVSPSAETWRASPAQKLWDAAATAKATFDENRLRAALAQLARALAVAHAAGKIHRDIKPSNILVTREDRVVLLDFGLVTGVAPSDQSTAMHPVGTADYMAPEQAASKRVGPEADWYSVGVVLYQALTGRLPFAGAPLEVMLKKHQANPEPPSAVCPSVPPDLSSLCMDLLHFDPRTRPTTAEVLVRLGAEGEPDRVSSGASFTQTPPFVGRQPELQALHEAFDASRKGTAVAVLVEGESGVGKSTLVHRFTQGLEGRGAVVLAGRCYECEAVPYKAVDGVVDALSRYMARLPAEDATALLPRTAGLVGDVFPVMRRVKAVATAPRLHAESRIDPQELRSRLFAAMREIFGRLADRHSLVVVIDDLQWADADSLAMVGEVLRPPEAPALLAIATMRTGTARALPDMLRFLPGDARRIDLGRLPRAEAQELAATLLKRVTTASSATAEAIATEAEGHPLFIDELVRHVASLEGTGPLALRLDEALRTRIAGLPAQARHVLELVAIAGSPLPQDVVARAASIEPSELARSIGLLRVGNLVQTTGARGGDTVAPYHDRVREAVAAHLAEDTRRGHHADLAAALEATAQPDPEVLAVHWQGTGDSARAAAYAEQAAAAAAAAFAFDRAARLYRTTLDLRPPDHPSTRELLVKLADALANAGRGAEAADTYHRAAHGASSAEALDLQRFAAVQLMNCGHVDEGLAAMGVLSAATGIRIARTPRTALPGLLLRRAMIRTRGYGFRVRDASQVAREQLGHIDLCLGAAAALTTIDAIRGAHLNARGLLMCLRAGEPGRLARALALEAGHVSLGGGPARKHAERVLQALRRLLRTCDEPTARAWAVGASGVADYYVGRFRVTLDQLDEAERMFLDECTGTVWEVDLVRLFMLWSLTYLGRIAELSRHAPQLVAAALDRGDVYAATTSRLSIHNVAWLVDDNVEEARGMAREALRDWSPVGSLVHSWWGPTAEIQLELYERAGRAAQAMVMRGWGALKRTLLLRVQTVRIEAWHLRARAALAAAAESPDERTRLLHEAERDAKRIFKEKMPWSNPLAELVLGGVAESRGDQEAAVRRCAAAANGFEAADMALYAAAARRRQGQLLGGDEGRGLVEAAEAWMRGQKIKNPARWTAMLAPGFPD